MLFRRVVRVGTVHSLAAVLVNRVQAQGHLFSMERRVPGLHHVTAIAGDPQQNLDFYAGLLGLRLVKLTVNYDDPEMYHFYYGDGSGSPGTILTFFPWPAAQQGRRGTGQATVVSFSIPQGAMAHWIERLKQHSIAVDGPAERFGEPVLTLRDPDGLRLELVESRDAREPWVWGPVPEAYAIRGLHSVTLSEAGYERTATLLTRTLGFRLIADAGKRFRYATGDGGPGALVDVECLPDLPPGRISVGTVHHVAWRARDDMQHQDWRRDIAALGYNVTPVIDRRYFHSIYFREPGGILFEIATDEPGFAADESVDQLGSSLRLPPWLEARRKDLELRLPPLKLPARALGA